MKRINNRIDYQETGRFELMKLTERYFADFFGEEKKSWIHVSFIIGQELCNVYTNKGTVLTARIKLNGETTYPFVFDKKKRIISGKKRRKVIRNIRHNEDFNCHGFTFLDGMFWFLLDNETVDIIIRDDGYKKCELETLKENGVCLYYNEQNEFIHSARVVGGIIQSKFGINKIITRGEQEIIDKYKGLKLDNTKTRYYNPSQKI